MTQVKWVSFSSVCLNLIIEAYYLKRQRSENLPHEKR